MVGALGPNAPRYLALGRVGLRRLLDAPAGAPCLIGFPFLGGQSLSLRPLAEALAEAGDPVALYGVDPPGHGWARGAPERDAAALLDVYAAELGPWLAGTGAEARPPGPLYLYGHSMGGVVALRLVQAGVVRPDGLLVSGAPVPHRLHEYRHLAALSTTELVGRLGPALPGGAPPEAVRGLIELLGASLRADVAVLSGLAQGSTDRVECPLSVMYSAGDPVVPSGVMHEWRRYGARVRFEVAEGGHLFPTEAPAAVAAWIRRGLGGDAGPREDERRG